MDNDVCIFCFKSIEDNDNDNLEENDGSYSVTQFYKFLSRICGKLNVSSEDASCKLLATCSACVNIVDSFSELYHQVECLKLQMEWKLDKLKNVMKFADRIPSRGKLFRSRYTVAGEYRQLFDTRNVIKSNVSEYLSHVFPKVRLERLPSLNVTDYNSNFDFECKPGLPKLKLEPHLPLKINPLLGWLSTVIAVTMCMCPVRFYYKTQSLPDTSSQHVAPFKLDFYPVSVSEIKSKVPQTPVDIEPEHFDAENELEQQSLVLQSPEEAFESTTDDHKINLDMSPHASDIEEDRSMEPYQSLHHSSGDDFSYMELNPKDIASNMTAEMYAWRLKMGKDSNGQALVTEEMVSKEPCPVLKMYKSTNGKFSLTELMVSTLKITLADIQLKGVDIKSLKISKLRTSAKCPVCSLSFPNCNEVPLVHLVNEHDVSRLTDPDKVFKCDLCPGYFLTLNQLRNHSQTHLDPPPSNGALVKKSKFKKTQKPLPINPHAGSVVITQDGLTIDNILDPGNAWFRCKVDSCSVKFFTEKDLLNHSKLHGGFKCPVCPVMMKFAPDLANHEMKCHSKINPGQPKLKCNRCKFTSMKKEWIVAHYLQVHMNLTPDKVTIICPLCKISFCENTFRTDHLKQVLFNHFLRRHKKEYSQSNNDGYMCEQCGESFKKQINLRRHVCPVVCPPTVDSEPEPVAFIVKTEPDFYNYSDQVLPTPNLPTEPVWMTALEHQTAANANFLQNFSERQIQLTILKVTGASEFENIPPSSRRLRSKFKCQNCQRIFSTEPRLTAHSQSCTKNDNEDEEDEEEETIQTNCNNDMSISHKECLKIYKSGSTSLSEKIVSTLNLTAADIRLKDINPLMCPFPECDSELFSNSAQLIYHQNLHGLFDCYFCVQTFEFAPKLISHELEHNSHLEKVFCPRCPEVKVYAMDYRKHFVEHHLETGVKYKCAQCPVCSMLFPEREQVPLVHMLNAHDVSRLKDPEKVFTCGDDNCSAYFLTLKQLINHSQIMRHDRHKVRRSKKDVGCDNCERKCKFLAGLDLHKNENVTIGCRKCSK